MVYRSKTPEHLSSLWRALRGFRLRSHGLLLLVGLAAGACLDPKSDDLPRPADNGSSPDSSGGPTGSAGEPGVNGGTGSANENPPSSGSAGSAGAGGLIDGEGAAGAGPDAGPEVGDADIEEPDAGAE